MSHRTGHGEPMTSAARVSYECSRHCVETLAWCTTQGGAHTAPDHVALMQSCAEICTTAANAMSRGMPGHEALCAACAEICSRCAASCEAIGGERMQHCAMTCRECERSCREMAGG